MKTASTAGFIVHPDDRGWFAEAWMEASLEGVPFAARLRLRRRDGAWRWVVFHATPRFHLDGVLAGYAGRLTGIPN